MTDLRQCKKLAYTTKSEAKKAVKRYRKKSWIRYAYHCPGCGKWHITSTSPKGRKQS